MKAVERGAAVAAAGEIHRRSADFLGGGPHQHAARLADIVGQVGVGIEVHDRQRALPAGEIGACNPGALDELELAREARIEADEVKPAFRFARWALAGHRFDRVDDGAIGPPATKDAVKPR